MMKKSTIKLGILGLLLVVPSIVSSAKAVFLISPVKNAPVILYPGQIVTVVYKVINNTPFPLTGNKVGNLPVGITQAIGGCGKVFNLPRGRSCLLYLTINGDKLKSNLKGIPQVCSARPVYCSIPTAANQLNIVKRPKPLAVLSVSPTSISFLQGGITRIVTITNKGPVNALAVKLATSPALGIRVSNNCPASLSYVAPKNTCQLTFISSNTIGSTRALIAGANTSSSWVAFTVAPNPNPPPSLSIISSERLLNLDDINTPLKITILNAAGHQATAITTVQPPDGWDDVTVTLDEGCGNLEGGKTCIVTLTAGTGAIPYIPATLKITGDNHANVLTPKIATIKGGGVVFYADSGLAKVATIENTTYASPWLTFPSLPPLLGSVLAPVLNALVTDNEDGQANTNILKNLSTTLNPVVAALGLSLNVDSAADLCTNRPFNNDGGSSWYLPAICELGYEIPGGPGGCNPISKYQDMMSLKSIEGIEFQGIYWSSSAPTLPGPAWTQNFADNNQKYQDENLNYNVRCARLFNY